MPYIHIHLRIQCSTLGGSCTEYRFGNLEGHYPILHLFSCSFGLDPSQISLNQILCFSNPDYESIRGLGVVDDGREAFHLETKSAHQPLYNILDKNNTQINYYKAVSYFVQLKSLTLTCKIYN